jgi:hypothetical protein
MLMAFSPGSAIGVDIPLIDTTGNPLVPVGLRWRLVDESETELQAWTDIEIDAVPPVLVSVTVDSTLNLLPAGAARGIRTVYLEVSTENGVVDLSYSFMLQAVTTLIVPSNSFVTYNEALLIGADFSNLTAWAAATRPAAETALIEARRRLVRLNIDPNILDAQDRLTSDVVVSITYRLEDLTLDQFRGLESHLAVRLKRAQIIEANEILKGDPLRSGNSDGLSSLTVGESTQFYRESRPVNMGLCRDAYIEIARFVRGVRLGRR